MSPTIRYLQHDDIDPDKWDACVRNASNGLIYGYSFYLDHMAKHWDGLVLGDYEAVMPLTWNKKFGVHYLYQPPFTAAGGVYGNQLDASIVDSFLTAIPEKFKLIDINLNSGNSLKAPHKLRNNYVLPLSASHGELSNNYRENIRRNIKRAQRLGCTVRTEIPVMDIITIAREQLKTVVQVSDSEFHQFEKLYEYLRQQKQATSYGVFSSGGELIASCVYFFSHNRAYYILVGNHPNGKTSGASHYLIDRFIADYAGTNLLLDFEGSDIRNLGFFYSSFGAGLETYPAIHMDKLPWYARVIRKIPLAIYLLLRSAFGI